MPRTPRFPKYPGRVHTSRQARIVLDGKAVYLGKFGSPESWAEYNRLLNEWRARQSTAGASAPAGQVRTVGELVVRFLEYADQHYKNPDGTPKPERNHFRHAVAPLLRLYGRTLLQDFGPKAMRTVQAAMASGSWLTDEERARLRAKRPGCGDGWCRRVVNRMTTRIKTLFRWGVREELIPESKANALDSVRGLAEGEFGVRETEDTMPVPEENLAKTLAELKSVQRALVETLLLTGARPSELFRLTPAGIDRTGSVELGPGYRVQLGEGCWAFQPRKHKTSYKGHRRVILFGPKAQALLQPLLEGKGQDDPVFSPQQAVARWRTLQRQSRKSKVQPSQESRAKAQPRRKPGKQYTCSALDHALAAACERAGVPCWSCYQLRHSAATRVLEQFGPEVARTVLGHAGWELLATYAVDSLRKAADAAREAG